MYDTMAYYALDECAPGVLVACTLGYFLSPGVKVVVSFVTSALSVTPFLFYVTT